MLAQESHACINHITTCPTMFELWLSATDFNNLMMRNSNYGTTINLNSWDDIWECFNTLSLHFNPGARQLGARSHGTVLELQFILALHPIHSLGSSMIVWLDEATFCDLIRNHSSELAHVPRDDLVQAFHCVWDLVSLWGCQLWTARHRRINGVRQLQLFIVPSVPSVTQ